MLKIISFNLNKKRYERFYSLIVGAHEFIAANLNTGNIAWIFARMRVTSKAMRWITFGWVSLAIFNLLGRAVRSGLNNLEN